MTHPGWRAKRWGSRFDQITAIRDGDEFTRPGVADMATEICDLEDLLAEAGRVLKEVAVTIRVVFGPERNGDSLAIIEGVIRKIEERDIVVTF